MKTIVSGLQTSFYFQNFTSPKLRVISKVKSWRSNVKYQVTLFMENSTQTREKKPTVLKKIIIFNPLSPLKRDHRMTKTLTQLNQWLIYIIFLLFQAPILCLAIFKVISWNWLFRSRLPTISIGVNLFWLSLQLDSFSLSLNSLPLLFANELINGLFHGRICSRFNTA